MIAIIGGGIGGLSAALALRQAGYEPEVFEQAPALLDVGAAIAIWPNAMRVLDRLQLAEKIREQAGVMEEIRWLDQKGWLINRVSIRETSEDGRYPALALHRADLQHILLAALPQPSIHLGTSLIKYVERHDKIVATFTNGRSIAADFLIAADGIHSRVRSQLLGDNDPVDRGYTVWRGIAPAFPTALPSTTAIELHGCGKRFGIGPVGRGRTGWWAAVNNAGDGNLLRLFAGWYPPVIELIAATPSTSILRTTALDRPATRTWGRGRLTLLGDAIHPTTPNLGQGGCLAMEDAMVLARSFEKYGPTEEALRNYERARYRRTSTVANYSRYYGVVGQWENIWARGLRRTALSLAPESLALRLTRIVFDYNVTTVNL